MVNMEPTSSRSTTAERREGILFLTNNSTYAIPHETRRKDYSFLQNPKDMRDCNEDLTSGTYSGGKGGYIETGDGLSGWLFAGCGSHLAMIGGCR